MAVDSPANIAILGAGPIGLEAALYARFLGYEVQIFEKGTACQNVLDWKHVTMFSPFELNSTPLSLAAISAQCEDFVAPSPEAILTGQQFFDQYLKPLAQTDLVADCIKSHTEVVSVSRHSHTKQDGLGTESREESPFRILVRHDGKERIETSDIVIDTTGTYGNRKHFGNGGIPAIGESSVQVHSGIPDFSGADRSEFADRHTLVIGNGYSAATSIVQLSRLIEENPNTKATWIVRNKAGDNGPIHAIQNDSLKTRDELCKDANQLALAGHPNLQFFDQTHVESVANLPDGKIKVELNNEHDDLVVDQLISNVGYRPDTSIFSELQVHQCYVSEGPMKLAAALMGSDAVDCTQQTSHGPESLLTSEPHFYILGSKSYGRNSNFLLSIGHAQIRDLFTIIGDRADLDLYKTIKPL